MKKQYNAPKLTQFGTVEHLTQYGSSTGGQDFIFVGNTPQDPSTFLGGVHINEAGLNPGLLHGSHDIHLGTDLTPVP